MGVGFAVGDGEAVPEGVGAGVALSGVEVAPPAGGTAAAVVTVT